MTKPDNDPKCDIHPLIRMMQYMGTITDISYHRGNLVSDEDERRGLSLPKQRTAAVRARQSSWGGGKLATRGWSAFTALLTWANFLRVVASFDMSESFGTKMFIKLVVMVWYFQCCWNVTVCFYSSVTAQLLPQLIASWTYFLNKHYPLPVATARERRQRKMNISTKIWIVISTFFISCNIPLILYILFSGEEAVINIYDVLTALTGDHPIMKLIYVFGQVLFAGTWVLPLGLYVTVCYVLTVEYGRICSELQGAVDRGTDAFWKILEKERSKHDELCKLVNKTNETFKIYTASCFMTNIIMVCLIIYMLLWPTGGKKEPYLIILNAFLLVMDAMNLFLVIWMGAKLHESIHAPAKNIFSFRANIREEEGLSIRMLQLNLFLFRLQGPPIGLTVVGLFVITMASLLSVSSVFATFFILLLRFQMAGGDSLAGYNDTTIAPEPTPQAVLNQKLP